MNNWIMKFEIEDSNPFGRLILNNDYFNLELISKQDAIDALNEYFSRIEKLKKRGLTKKEEAIRLDMIGTINSLLSIIPPQPKIGHWEYVQYDYNPNIGNWHCSECRNIIIECTDKNKRGCAPTYSYCPYCGVKMSEFIEL